MRSLGRAFGRVASAAGGVRARITVVATLVAGLAVLAAGLWLVHGVEGSLDNDLRASEAADVAQVSQALAGGSSPSELDLRGLTSTGDGSGQALQIVSGGKVVASSPNVAGMPPLDSAVMVSNTAGPGGVAGAMTRQEFNLPNGAYAVTRADVDSGSGPFTVIAASPLDPIRRTVAAVENGLMVALPLLVVAVGLLTWFLTGRALRPVESIRAEVESITGSTLSLRVPVPDSGDEVARLARTMNAMLDRLEASSLRQAQFVADASHELRSPVTAIRTELEVARRSAAPDDWPAVVDQVLLEESRLEATIADLLLLASIDEGAPLPDPGPVDLAEVVATVVERSAKRTDGVAVGALDRPAGAAPVVVDGSTVQLARVVGNLVDNAARHAASSVVVSVTAESGRAVVTVDDDGPGIPEADRERIFERFTRLDGHRARTAGHGGAGLGLALVRQLVERHGGTVHAETAPSGGARLVVTVPIAQGAAGDRSNVATTGAWSDHRSA